jgi:thiamine pyrophosphokinase
MVFKYGEIQYTAINYKKTQKKVIWYINTKQRISHTDPLFKNSKILKVYDLYQLHTTIFMYEFKNDYLFVFLGSLFKNNKYRTRQKHNLIANKPRIN